MTLSSDKFVDIVSYLFYWNIASFMGSANIALIWLGFGINGIVTMSSLVA